MLTLTDLGLRNDSEGKTKPRFEKKQKKSFIRDLSLETKSNGSEDSDDESGTMTTDLNSSEACKFNQLSQAKIGTPFFVSLFIFASFLKDK